ncbi:MAG: hypothetical protein H6756_05080 [Candidatus Omnitrophica bacterium]|nr:hypothetical protein [Candidatus Omnitrophota bacterium]
MLDDLLANYNLVGLSKENLIQLLGARENQEYSDEYIAQLMKSHKAAGRPQDQLDSYLKFYKEMQKEDKFVYYLSASKFYDEGPVLEVYFENDVVSKVNIVHR